MAMRTRGFFFGSLVIVTMVAVSSAAFVETSHPVSPATASCEPGMSWASSGNPVVPSSCAEVHATALAAGKLSTEQYVHAQSQLTALAAHANPDQALIIPAVASRTTR